MQDIKLQIAEDGKGLSTNDYTDEAKTKVDAIPENPEYTDTVYTHPESHPASMIEQDSTRRMVSDTQIAEWTDKMDKGGIVTVGQIDKNSGKFDQSFMTDEFMQQVTGNAPVSSTPVREGVVRSSVADNAIYLENVNFIKKPNNLFNENTVKKGYSLDQSTGAEVVNSTAWVSDFIYVKKNQTYVKNESILRFHLYDESLNFIQATSDSTVTTTENTYFIRLVGSGSNYLTAQMNIGDTLLGYDEYKAKFKEGIGLEIKPTFETVTREAMTRDVVDPFAFIPFKKPKNIWNKHDVTVGKTLSGSSIVDDSTFVLGNILYRMKANTTYSKSNSTIVIAYYDIDKNYLSKFSGAIGSTTPTFTTPAGCYYAKISVRASGNETFMLNEGNTLLPYEDYVFELQSTDEFPLKISSNIATEGVGESEVLAIVNKQLKPFRSYNYERLTYGELVSSLSDTGCVVEQLGLCSDGVNHVYGLSYGDVTTKPVIFLIGNQHGMEWVSAHYPVDFMRRIANADFYDSIIINNLRDEFAFYTIVSANPWGYINSKYTNENGVNLNRNWDNNWETFNTGEGTIQYKGTAPFSEPETQLIKDKIISLKPYMIIDCHASDGKGGIDKVGGDYQTSFENSYQELINIYNDASLPVQLWNVTGSPTATGWAKLQMSKEGTKTMPNLIEQPMKFTGNYGLTALFVLSLLAYNKYVS